MANYSLVAGPTYNPLDFETQLKVLQLTQARHDELENAYGELGTLSDAVGSRLDENADPIAYARWKQYNDALDANADALSKYGLNPQSRRSLLDTKRYYAKQVAPIDLALQNRAKIQDEARKQHLANPTWYTENDVLNASVDRWLENEGYDWGKQYSGAMLTQQVSEQLAPLAKALANYGTGKNLDSQGITKTLLTQYGITPDQAAKLHAAYLADPEGVSRDTLIPMVIGNVVDAAVGKDWNPETRDAAIKNAYRYAEMGINNAIGTTGVQPFTDQAKWWDYQINHPRPTKDRPTGTTTDSTRKMPYVTVTGQAVQNPEKERVNYVKFAKYFDSNGKDGYVLNDAGKRAMAYARRFRSGIPDEARKAFADAKKYGIDESTANDFYTFVYKNLGFRTQSSDAGIKNDLPQGTVVAPNAIGNAYGKYINDLRRVADSKVMSGYSSPIDDATGKRILDRLRTDAKDGNLHHYEWNGITNQFTKTKTKLTPSDISDNHARVVGLRGYENGCLAVILDDNGTYTVKIPDDWEEVKVATDQFKAAAEYNRALRKNNVPAAAGDLTPLRNEKGDVVYTNREFTPEEWNTYEGYEYEAMMDGLKALLGIGAVNTVPPIKINAESPLEDVSGFGTAYDYLLNNAYGNFAEAFGGLLDIDMPDTEE